MLSRIHPPPDRGPGSPWADGSPRAWLAAGMVLAALPLLALLAVLAIAAGSAGAIVGALLAGAASLALAALLAARLDRKLARDALQQAQASAESASAARDELLALLGHDLRNPLGAISAAVDVLESGGADDETAAEARSIIARQTRSLSHMLDDLLDVNRLVRLPAADPVAPPEGDALPLQRRRKVLVVDDNQDALAALRAKLELEGHTVSTAADGHAGLNRLLLQRPEVSIVAVGLSGITGFELARHARAAGYAGRMIALSGDRHDRDGADAMVAGFDACLVEPVDRVQLRASIGGD